MSAPLHRAMSPREWGLLAILSVLWGGTFLFLAVAVREIPPLTIVFARVALAALLLVGLARIAGQALPATRSAWRLIAGMAVLNNVVPFTLFAFAQTTIGAAPAAILNATTPLFGVLVMHLGTRDEKATGEKVVGALVGFLGVAVMIGPAALDVATLGTLPAQLACLGGALSYALSGLQGRRVRAIGLSPLGSAAGQVTASSAILLPMALLWDRPWTLPMPSAVALACVLALAILSTALAYVIFFRILASAGATNLLLVTFLIPISAILLGVLVLGERLEPRQIAGMALIGLGLAAIDGRPWARLRRR